MLDISVIIMARNIYEKEEEMPPIFKALATIMAWILWIVSLMIGFGAFVMAMVNEHSSTAPPPVIYYIAWAVALGYAIGGVVVMLLRKKMESSWLNRPISEITSG
jgi:hypothetical protein